MISLLMWLNLLNHLALLTAYYDVINDFYVTWLVTANCNCGFGWDTDAPYTDGPHSVRVWTLIIGVNEPLILSCIVITIANNLSNFQNIKITCKLMLVVLCLIKFQFISGGINFTPTWTILTVKSKYIILYANKLFRIYPYIFWVVLVLEFITDYIWWLNIQCYWTLQ